MDPEEDAEAHNQEDAENKPKSNMKIKVTNIVYDTDGESISDLPNEMIVNVEGVIDVESEIADAVSDSTGWCVESYNYEIL